MENIEIEMNLGCNSVYKVKLASNIHYVLYI